MVKNVFTDILLNWGSFSDKTKQQRIQEFENMVARFYNRRPRKIKYGISPEKMSELKEYRTPKGYYERSEPSNIYIKNLSLDLLEIISLIVHEGYHALIHDYLLGKASLKAFSKIDKDKFLMEEEYLDVIGEYFDDREQLPLFDTFYAEERLNYLENSIYISKLIIDAIESPFDANVLFPKFIETLNIAVFNEYRGEKLEEEYGIKYDEAVVLALNEATEENKNDYSHCGKIKSEIDPEYLKFYNAVYADYYDFYKILHNDSISKDAKDRGMKIKLDLISQKYFSFVMELLKQKRKI